jgi:mannosyl-3-phosphoglycerate synthase
MRLEYPRRTERFGAVHIRELQRVIELDSGAPSAAAAADGLGPSQCVPAEGLREIERDLVIVVPCMNETRKVIEGVLCAGAQAPHDRGLWLGRVGGQGGLSNRLALGAPRRPG